ncbi:LPS assembly lipoprotein LptE [Roseisalinus antarcticus]|uniref:LPS-assembly lipoprotein n=1 Tax=Roseisalinus antarcticus TaxID=254357 RepID=A0A1Y5SK61_9RHOB|nr:LPS assembly lipoprotein LptE [Roseisalinus antarcticus]SLN42724.1 hypothetical protein ROA7023_01723 [Roseisalinus antarcticus]
MWSSEARLSRRAALFGAAVLLAACGFSPVYGPGSVAERLRGQVSVEAPATDTGYRLRQRLIQRLGAADAPRYHIVVALDLRDAAVAITAEQATTRFNLPGAAQYRLTDRTTGDLIQSGTVDTFTSYSATGTAVSTFAAEADARRRLAVALADLIVTRLATVTLP